MRGFLGISLQWHPLQKSCPWDAIIWEDIGLDHLVQDYRSEAVACGDW